MQRDMNCIEMGRAGASGIQSGRVSSSRSRRSSSVELPVASPLGKKSELTAVPTGMPIHGEARADERPTSVDQQS